MLFCAGGALALAAEPNGALAAAPRASALSPLLPGETRHLAPGRYLGPIVLPAGVTLIGGPDVVLTAGPGAVIVWAPSGGTLRDLTLEGGGWGVVCAGDRPETRGTVDGGPNAVLSVGPNAAGATLSLEQVRVRGQTEGAVRVERKTLWARDLSIQTSVAGSVGASGASGERIERSVRVAVGIEVGAGAHARIAGLNATGLYRRALRVVDGATLELRGAVVEGALTAVHATDADVDWQGGRVRGAGGGQIGAAETGPAVFVARGHVVLDGVEISGHEYAVLARDQASVTLRRFGSARARQAAIGLVRSQLTGEQVRIEDSGPLGAVQGVESQLTLDRFVIHRARAFALTAVGGSMRLDRGEVAGVTADLRGGAGEAIHAGRARVEGHDLTLRDAVGGCVVAVEGGQVILARANLTRCGGTARGPPGSDPGDHPGGSDDGGAPPVWADCGSGASIRLSSVGAAAYPHGLPSCVTWDAR